VIVVDREVLLGTVQGRGISRVLCVAFGFQLVTSFRKTVEQNRARTIPVRKKTKYSSNITLQDILQVSSRSMYEDQDRQLLAHCTYLVVHQTGPNSEIPFVGLTVLTPYGRPVLACPDGVFRWGVVL
jgi:hypothetical protein